VVFCDPPRNNDRLLASSLLLLSRLEQIKLERKHSIILQRWYKNILFNRKLPTLWKIAEFYTSVKYHPDNIIESQFLN